MINYPIYLDPPGKQRSVQAFVRGFAGSLCESGSCSRRWLQISRKGLTGNKLLPAAYLHQQRLWIVGKDVNAGSRQRSWLFVLLVSVGNTIQDCPWKPISENLPLEVQPVWFPPGFSQPSFQLCCSMTWLALRILSFLPFPSPTKGIGDGERGAKRGITASQLAAVAGTLRPSRLLQTNAPRKTHLVCALSRLRYL